MQKALDDLVRHYIISETRYEKAEKEDSNLEGNINEAFEDEYIKALYDCLENKGVVCELQTFLRQRLVAILQDKWPNLGEQDELISFNPVAIRLVQDFLCSHKLLYTFSVLASEIGQIFSLKQPFGKLSLSEAEKVLDQLDIKKIGSSHKRILQGYLEKDRFSLLECIISNCPWSSESASFPKNVDLLVSSSEKREKLYPKTLNENNLHLRKTLDGKKKNLNDISNEPSEDTGVKDRLKLLEDIVQNDQQNYSLAISRYKEEDAKRIYDEIETRLKFEMLTKEKELLKNYEEKVALMRKTLDREREVWLSQRDRDENELFQHKEHIILLMNSLTEKQLIVKSLLENYQSQCINEETEFHQKERSFLLKEAELNSTIEKLREENKILKTIHRTVKQDTVYIPEINPEPLNTNKVRKTDRSQTANNDTNSHNDTIAFLKYSLECQAEEIKLLRSDLVNSQSRYQTDIFHQSVPMGNTVEESKEHVKQKDSRQIREKHLEEFISNSKKRCDEIEKEAQEIERSLESFKDRASGKNLITRTSMLTPSGRLNLLPSVPKIPFPVEAPHSVDQSVYFQNLLGQMFPSRDYSFQKPYFKGQSFPAEPFRQSSERESEVFPRAQAHIGKFQQINEAFRVDSSMLSKLHENLQDLTKLVNTAAADSIPPTQKHLLNAILENGETSNENHANGARQLNNGIMPGNPKTHTQNLKSINGPLSVEHLQDTLVTITSMNSKQAETRLPSVPSATPDEGSNMVAKASESGALIKEKVQLPSVEDKNTHFTDKSESSISVRSIMKTKINFENNGDGSQKISSKQLKTNGDEDDYLTEEELQDVSISAPDISQSHADDFWNV